MSKQKDILTTILENFCVWMMILLQTVVFLGVVFRYALNKPLIWVDELASIIMVYITFIGSAVAVKYNQHMRMTVLDMVLSPKNLARWQKVVDLCSLVFLAFLVWVGWRMVGFVGGTMTDILRLPVSFVYFAIPLGLALMVVYMLAGTLVKED
ncbi:MAG: TRAP transporter small permease [Firmicutes bacterium]|jgi:TRAP-type C4-dicarboxylate transport system permease small subunit|nr:TRAP transporter small permease [Bacillota bacterium]